MVWVCVNEKGIVITVHLIGWVSKVICPSNDLASGLFALSYKNTSDYKIS